MTKRITRKFVRHVCTSVWFVACCYLSACQSTALGQLPTAELQSLSRQVIQSGAASELTLQGSRLDESRQLLAHDMSGTSLNLPATPRLAPAQPMRDDQQTTNVFDLPAGNPLPPGLIELRSVGRFGVSNPRNVLISALPVDVPAGGHNIVATAHPIKADHLINDKTSERASHYYRCDVKPGQRLRCAAYCKQLDSLAELNLRLLQQSGQLIVSARTNGQWPAEFSWINSSSVDQQVFIEARDLLYRGGANFNFVLEARLDDAASIPNAQPLHLDSMLRPSLELPLRIAKLSQAQGTVFAQRGWNEAAALPSTTVEQFPVRLQGDLQQTRVVTFNAQKDQALTFDIGSAALDQLTDPAIVVYKVNVPKPDGTPQLQQVAEQDDAAYAGTPAVRIRRIDPQLVWKAPETATYQLHIIDRQTGQRPADSRRFLLEIRPPQPSFTLIVHQSFPTNNLATSKPWGAQLTRNGAIQLHVTVIRNDGFSDAIELQAQGLPAGCKCLPVIVPPGAVEADLVLQAGSEIDASLAQVAIVGTAKVGEQTMTAQAVAATVSSGAIPTRNAIASRSSASLLAQLINVDTAPVQVQLGDGNTIEVKAGAKFNLPIKLTRQPNGATECTLRPQALPPKIGLGEQKIAPDKSDAAPEINVPADAPVGEHTFWVLTETKVKWRANPQQLEREEGYAAKLKSALEANSTGDIPRPQIEAALTQANARVEELKKSTAEQEYTVFVPSNAIRLRILPKD